MGTILTKYISLAAPHALTRVFLTASAALLVSKAHAWTPGVGSEASTSGFTVNTDSRNDVISFWNSVYERSEGYEERIGWTGSVSSGNAGTISVAFKNDVQRRINFYRAMAGMSANIKIDSNSPTLDNSSGPTAPNGTTKETAAQAAALMLSANTAEFLNGGGVTKGEDNPHNPPSNWNLDNSKARNAAYYSNLAVGKFGPGAIDSYMLEDDQGAGQAENSNVGHRRYLLHSRLQQVATGDVTASGSNRFSANALYVSGDLLDPTNSPQFISWPNSGFIPEAIVPERWSLSFPEADFSAASISMRDKAGNTITTAVVSRKNGFGDNTITWKPASSSIFSAETEDITCDVTVSGIIINGTSTSHSYLVTIINPNRLTTYPTLSGNSSPEDISARFHFNQIDHAEEYELNISKISSASWTEGAETEASDQVLDGTSNNYNLRSSYKWSHNGQKFWDAGNKAFHLAFPDNRLPLSAQTFTINRAVIPQTDASLSFRLCRGYMSSKTRLEVQYSVDGGGAWTTLSSFTGKSSGAPDNSFVTKSVNLASAGNQTLIRFLFHQPTPTGVYDVTNHSNLPVGSYIDNITFSKCDWLEGVAQVSQPKTADYVTLDNIPVGETIAQDSNYTLRIRPKIGTRWLPYGPSLEVTSASTLDPDDNEEPNVELPPTILLTASAGKYSGFLTSSQSGLAGYFKSFKVSSSGKLSSKLSFGGASYSLKGSFDQFGVYEREITSKSGATVIVKLQLVQTEEGAYKVAGTLEQEGQTASVVLVKSGIVDFPGRYTLLIPSEEDESTPPQGHGYGVMSVSSKGSAKIKGRLGDGSKWTAKCKVAADGEMPLYRGLYKKKRGWIGGLIRFREVEGISDCDGEVYWYKPGKIELKRNLIGSTFTPQQVIAGDTLSDLVADLGAGVGAEPVFEASSHTLGWTKHNKEKAYYVGSTKTKLTLSTKSGVISGYITDQGVKFKVAGVVYQKQDLAAGMVTAKRVNPRSLVIAPDEEL